MIATVRIHGKLVTATGSPTEIAELVALSVKQQLVTTGTITGGAFKTSSSTAAKIALEDDGSKERPFTVLRNSIQPGDFYRWPTGTLYQKLEEGWFNCTENGCDPEAPAAVGSKRPHLVPLGKPKVSVCCDNRFSHGSHRTVAGNWCPGHDYDDRF